MEKEVNDQDFMTLLGELRKGRAVQEFNKELHRLMDECAVVNKPGTLTLTLTVTPMKDDEGEVDRFAFKEKVAIRPPARETGVTIMFVDEEGALSRRDRRQPELPTISGGAREASNG